MVWPDVIAVERLITAVPPTYVAVPTRVSPPSTTPFALLSKYRFTEVIPVVKVPVPEAVRVMLVMVAALLPGLPSRNCITGTVTP